jgi:L-threonylcarbamoyladenylate synthase
VDVSVLAERLVARHWPGPLSLILRASPLVPARVCGQGGTLALRMPKDDLCQALIERIGGPVVASSANLTRQPPSVTAEEVLKVFGNQVDLVLDGGPRAAGRASTLVDVSGPRPRLLRRGAVDVAAELGDFEDLAGGNAAPSGGARLDSR